MPMPAFKDKIATIFLKRYKLSLQYLVDYCLLNSKNFANFKLSLINNWKVINMKKIVLFLMTYLFCNVIYAEIENNGWRQSQLNEKYMRGISKEQCMNKSITSLNKGCKTNEW